MRELPSGTVTFLFTDVEGSTRLLADLGDAYPDALLEHRRVMRHAFQAHGGVEVDTQGDSFFAAFSSATAAVRAAEEAQERLAIPVRMGIHTGEPTLTDEGYAGMDVHQGARICAVAHGGQIVLSRQAQALSGREPEVRDLGLHRLKDLADPVRLYQLGRREFPPLRSLNSTNLPALRNPLVGRERELAELNSVLRDGARLVTLTGPGGTGKTRLGLEAAADLIDEFPDGVFWTPLASVRDPELALATVEETIGAKAALPDYVGERRMLLLLDNFEQLLPAAAELATALERCPNLKILVTSRAPLRLSGEHEVEVPPLPETDAATLFMQRARAVRPDFPEHDSVVEICRRVDGLPLAIELAAARARIFEPDELLAGLDRRLPLLTGGARDLPARQQTLRATIEWSYDLLTPAEQEALVRLAVFARGCSAEAAEQVSDAGLEQLESLVEQSLLRFLDGRFLMLETIREFGLDRLRDRGEEEELKLRHAHYFVERAEQLGPAITESGGRDRLAALEQDSANIMASLSYLVATSDAEASLRLGGNLRLFWVLRGRAPVARELLERALDLDGSVAPRARARALSTLATLVAQSGDLQRSEELEEEALPLFEHAGDMYGVGRSLLSLAWLAAARSDLERAEELADKGLGVAEQLGQRALQGLANNHLGMISTRRRDFVSAREFHEKSHADWRASGNEVGATGALSNLATIRLLTGDLDGAEQLAEEALALNRAIPYEVHAASDLSLLGLIALERGEREKAAARFEESLAIHRDLADDVNAADSVELLAAAFPPGTEAEAASTWGAVASFRDRFKLQRPDESRHAIETAIEECRNALGEERFKAAWSSGYELSLEEAIERALAMAKAPPSRLGA